jgi:hypothetical protein
MIYSTQAELDKALKKWKKILLVRDWEIKAALVAQNEMEHQTARGEVVVDVTNKQVYINILRKEDCDDSFWTVDHEQTLVHELIHIYTETIEHKMLGSLPNDETEALVDKLAPV